MRPFVRITAIMDPPSWIFCQSPPLLQNYRKLILKYTRKINYQKNNQTKNFKTKSSLFRLTCLSKLGCHSNVTCHIKTIPVPLPPPLPRAKMTKAFFSFSSWGRGRSKHLLFKSDHFINNHFAYQSTAISQNCNHFFLARKLTYSFVFCFR